MDFTKLHIIPDLEELDKYLELAKKYGLQFEYNDFYMPWILDNEDRKTDIIDRYLERTDELPKASSLHGAFLDVTIFSYDEKIRTISEFRIRQSMDIASRIGAKSVIIHTNYIPTFLDDDYENSWVDKNYKFLSRLLKDYPDINIYMENMFDITPDLLARLADRLKDYSNFGVCLDYAHLNVFGKDATTPLQWVEKLAPYIKHVHINDNDFIKDRHWALGKGSIDYKEFFDLYNKNFPDATVLIEVKGIDKIRESIRFIEKNAD